MARLIRVVLGHRTEDHCGQISRAPRTGHPRTRPRLALDRPATELPVLRTAVPVPAPADGSGPPHRPAGLDALLPLTPPRAGPPTEWLTPTRAILDAIH